MASIDAHVHDKVALVTGAGQGIGYAVAVLLAQAGAAVACLDVNSVAAQAAATAVRGLGRASMAVALDLADVSRIEPAIQQVVSELGRIEILVNCAGVLQTKPLLELSESDWNRVLDVNLKGLFFCVQAVGRRMVQQRGGAIVNFSSVAGRGGRPLATHYAASKAGVISLTQSAALAFAPYGVRVNAVCPGIVETAMWEQIDADQARILGLHPGQARAQFISRVPLGRAASASEVAQVVLFLASDAASYVTGQSINVDGGVEMD